MATYTLDANPVDGTIKISGGGVLHTDTLDKLQSSTGPYGDLDTLKIDQKVINYLDAIKDGTKYSELQGLDMYDTGYDYPPFTELHLIENALLYEKKGNLSRTTWLKTKQDSRLNLIQTHHVFWESGLGYESFIELLQKGEPEIVTFGSYIDPLSKPGKIWPPRGNKIIITPNFMDQFGFGLSSITATTLADEITSGMKGGAFNYNMQVVCGTACTEANPCEIKDPGNNPDSNNVYFKGNGEKNKLVNKSGNSDLKTKLIVAKGWGDKVQVMLYYMYYHLHNKQAIMTTCDFVVFCFCITLNIPCVYTGIYDRPVDVRLNARDPVVAGKSYYSILQFTPGTPIDTAIQNYKNTIIRIYNENLQFIDNVSELALNPGTHLFVQGMNSRPFSKTFYDILIADMKQINLILDAQTGEMDYVKNIDTIKSNTDEIKRKYLIIPMFKYIKNGTKITFLQTKSYTSDKELMNKMTIQKPISVSFYDMAKNIALVGGAITRSQSRKIAQTENRELTNEQKEIFPKRDRKKKIARYLEEDINDTHWKVEAPLFIDNYGYEETQELQIRFDRDFYKKIKTLIGEDVEGINVSYDVADDQYIDHEHAAIAEGVAEPGCFHRVMNRFGASSCSVMGGRRRNVTRKKQKGGAVDEILFETLYTLYVYRAQYDIELDTPDQLVNMNVLRELYEEYKQNNNESNKQESVYNQQLKHKIAVPSRMQRIQRMQLTGNRRTARKKAPMRNRAIMRNLVKSRHVKKQSHFHNPHMIQSRGGRITRRKRRNGVSSRRVTVRSSCPE